MVQRLSKVVESKGVSLQGLRLSKAVESMKSDCVAETVTE